MRTILVLLTLLLFTAPVFAQTIPPPPGSVDTVAPVVTETPLDQLRDLQAKYVALKASKDKSVRLLLIAGAIATGLKLLLSGASLLLGGKKKWLAWIAFGLAVPIALLSHFAAGNSWFDSFVFAGAGPGAVFVHELVQAFRKPTPVTA